MTDISEQPDPAVELEAPEQDFPTDQSQEGSGSRQSLTGELRGLIDDFQSLIGSEIDYHKARISFTISQGKRISMLLVGVGVFGSAAAVAMVLGLLLALTPIIGPWWALAIVTCGSLAISALCFIIATRKTRRVQALYRSDEEEDEEDRAQ